MELKEKPPFVRAQEAKMEMDDQKGKYLKNTCVQDDIRELLLTLDDFDLQPLTRICDLDNIRYEDTFDTFYSGHLDHKFENKYHEILLILLRSGLDDKKQYNLNKNPKCFEHIYLHVDKDFKFDPNKFTENEKSLEYLFKLRKKGGIYVTKILTHQTDKAPTGKDKDITNLQEKLTDKDKDITNLQERLTEKDKYITNLQEKLTDKDKDIINLQGRLTEKDKDITNLQEKLTDKDKDITNLQRRLTEKDKDITNLQEKLTDKDKDIINLQEKLTDKDKDNTNFQRRLTENDKHITNLQERSSKKDKYITNLQARLTEKDKYITTLQRSLTG